MPSRLPIRLGNSGALMWRHPKRGPNPILFLATGNGTLSGQDQSGVLTLTPTGAQRYASTDWPGEQAFYIEQATMNLITNPSAEVNLTGIAAFTATTNTRDTASFAVGAASVKSVTTGASGISGVEFVTASGLGYTGSARTFIPQARVMGAGTLRLTLTVLYTDSSVGLGTAKNFTASGAWQTILGNAFTTDPAKAVNRMNLDVQVQSAQAVTFYTDAVQIEEKSVASSYTDGSLGTGYAWTGTAHGSSSTRAASTLTIPNTAAPTSLAYRYSEDAGTTWQFGYRSGVGALGTNGLIAVSGSDLVISTTRSLQIGPIAGYDRALSAGEQATLAATDPANWWEALA